MTDANLLIRDFNYKTPHRTSSLLRTTCCIVIGADLGSHLNNVLTSAGLDLEGGVLAEPGCYKNPVVASYE